MSSENEKEKKINIKKIKLKRSQRNNDKHILIKQTR